MRSVRGRGPASLETRESCSDRSVESESEANLVWILDFHLQLVLQAELVFELSDMDSNHTKSENVNMLGLIII